MPDKRTIERARADKRRGLSPSSQAGEFVRDEIEKIRRGAHGARSTKQAIAIGLSQARRAGVKMKTPSRGRVSEETRKRAKRDLRAGETAPSRKPSRKRSRATLTALKREGSSAVSHDSLSRHARSAASERSKSARSQSAKKAARTKGKAGRVAAATKAAQTRKRKVVH